MEHTLQKEQMESIKALAKANMDISEAKNILFKLQETETEYLETREKKALVKIHNILKDSQNLLDQIQNNHETVRQFASEVSLSLGFIRETYEKFQAMLENFNQRNEIWEKNIRFQNEQIANQRRQVEGDQKRIKEDEKSIRRHKEELEKTKREIESRQQALQASYKAEKDLWNKLNK